MNMTNMTNSFSTPADIISARSIRNQVFLPIIITFGIIANTITSIVVTRPKLRSVHFNLYIQAISLLDLVSFILRLPIVFDSEYCGYSNYSMAFYMTHFGWLIVNWFRSISSYVLVFLSLDRLMVVWYPGYLRHTTESRFKKKGLLFTVIWIFLTTYIPWTCLGKVEENGHQWLMSYNISPDQAKGTWFKLFKAYSALVLSGLPSVCIIGLSIGIVVGYLKRKIYSKEKSIGTNEGSAKKFYQTMAVLALNSSFVIFCLPYMVAILYIEHGRCNSKSTYAKETSIYLLESLSSFWSIANMLIFFLINKDYKTELINICKTLPLVKNYITNSNQELQSSSENN